MAINVNKSVKYIVKRDLKNIFPQEFVNRELIGKFFDYIMNHFFQKSYEKYVNGYIGKKSVAYEKGDLYIEEPTTERQMYQLTPMLVSQNKQNIIDYNNFINILKNQGCLTNNQNRLISSNYWSWCPPINVDMFLNYNFYYWMEEGVDVYEITTKTNVVKNVISKEQYSCEYIDENNETKTLTFMSGMRVRFLNDENIEYNNKVFIIEGVGNSIELIDDNELLFSRNASPDYYVMERGAIDGNDWSLRNRWFHRSVISNMKNRTVYILYDNETRLTFYTITPEDKINKNSLVYSDSKCIEVYKKFVDFKDIVYTNNTIETTYHQAKKPIICFNKDIQLYNYGTTYRGYIDLYLEMDKNQLQGSTLKELDGVKLEDGMIILLHTGDNSEDDNKLYEITGLSSVGVIVLQKSISGISLNGDPVDGEGVRVRNNGSRYANTYFYFNESENKWVQGQSKQLVNQSPLFQLYDGEKIKLDNPLYYNHSTFKGSKLFDYKISDDDSIKDVDLGKNVVSESQGNYIFDNILQNQRFYYTNYDRIEEIIGYKYFKINGTENYLNDWYYSDNKISQYIISEINILTDVKQEEYENDFGIVDVYNVFELNIEPDVIPNKKNNYIYINGDLKQEGIDYIIDGSKLKFYSNIKFELNDNIYIKLLKNNIDILPKGYYFDLPLSLTANVTNKEVSEIKYNECFDQMKSIIENQTNFNGLASGYNNYNNTKKDLSLGTEILQHHCPIYKSMILNSQEYTNIRNVLSFISDEYSKFKNKFRNTIINMSLSGEFSEQYEYDEYYIHNIVQSALDKINLGKEGLQPFYNNGVASLFENAYIPATPAYLGLDLCYQPQIQVLEESLDKPNVLLNHDGSYTKLFNDYRDYALIYLEEMVYQSINDNFKNGIYNYNKFEYIPGKFRNTEYSEKEYLELLSSFYEQWCNKNNINYFTNDEYDRNNPFSWNWSSCKDLDGNALRGNYKGIYLYYYDTYRPHTNPWEMLGFGNKPEWWENLYGKAPYTSNNIPMWKDIENGFIADGYNKGYHKEFERKGLIEKYLPVDINGNLLSPYQIGITTSEPLPYNASKEWEFGDCGKYEFIWMLTSEYRYSIQTLLYLMKPVEWLEKNWNTLNSEKIFGDTKYPQIIDKEYKIRLEPQYHIMHNEMVNGSYKQYIGVQQWISDYLTKENINISKYCGNNIRNINIQLGYKCGCYYKKDSIKIVSDNYGLIPSTDYSLNLYTSTTSRNYNYSAMIIQKVENGYMINGYDLEKPYFNVLEPEYNSKKSSVEVNNKKYFYHNVWTKNVKKVKYKTIFKSIQELYNVICGYGKYLENNEGWEFISIDENVEIVTWRNKAYDFLIWASLNPQDNSIVLLNPGCYEIKINHKSFIDKIGQYVNGCWSVLDTAYNPIYNEKITAYRRDYNTIITPTEKIMTLLKIRDVEQEHIILFNNKTTFGDVLFDSLLCIKTYRLKLMGIAVDGWNGTYFAPGYIIENDGAVPNYDKMAEDFNYVYDTDDIRSFGVMGDYAKKTVGFKELPYMSMLFLDDRNIFDFYKGMIHEKGTRKSFNKLNRSEYIMSNNQNKMELFENWAFKIGDFGYTTNDSVMELKIDPTKIIQNPQIVKFSTSDVLETKESINFSYNDEKWIKSKDNQNDNRFLFNENNQLLPTGGFVQVNDVRHIFADLNELDNNMTEIQNGDNIWIVNSDGRNWDVVKKLNNEYLSLKCKNIIELNKIDSSKLNDGDLLYIQRANLQKSINYVEEENGVSKIINLINDKNGLRNSIECITDKNCWIVVQYNKNRNNVISCGKNGIATKSGFNTLLFYNNITIDFENGFDENGKNKVERYITDKNISIDINNELTKYVSINNLGEFNQCINYFEQDEEPTEDLKENDVWYSPKLFKSFVYKENKWVESMVKIIAEVETMRDNNDDIHLSSYTLNYPYNLVRIENKTIDVNNIKSCYLVDDDTNETLSEVQLFDPLQCVLPNNIKSEINYITYQDPVNYNNANDWDELKVGYLWWDLSKVKYVNYHQGDNQYRRNNWGKQLPGSEIAIMEWTESMELPEELKNSETKKYIEKTIYNSTTLSYDTYYYYWTKNPSKVPTKDFRKNSALIISKIINSPQDMGIIWMSPISMSEYNGIESSFIIGNFDNVSTGKEFVIQINYQLSSEIDRYEEWILIKENTKQDIPDLLWKKLKASLTGYDEMGQIVPNPNLNNSEKYGISIRPRQTMFKDLATARHNFVDIVNSVFSSRDILSFIDVDTSDWKDVFQDVEETSFEISYHCPTHYSLNNIQDTDLIGKYIQVDVDENYENIWTVWLMNNIGDFTLVDYKSYDIEKYYNYADFYKDSLTAFSIPKYEIENEMEVINYIPLLQEGDIIKTYDNNGRWILKEYENGVLHTVGLENGVIYLNDKLYSFMNDETLINNDKNGVIFIDNLTMYQYLMNEVSIIIDKIISYFEK